MAAHSEEGISLRQLYKKDLQAALGGRKGRAYKSLTRALSEYDAGVLDVPDDRVKVWSDLHISHTNVIGYCDRPFRSVYEMDETLWSNWQTGVEPGETLVCVGDVFFGRVTEPRPVPQGHHKLLVLGNHDLTNSGELKVTEFDEVVSLLTAPGDPPLVFTHCPLPTVPDGYVNVHGHTHQKLRPPESPHINVSVEQLEYRPIALPWLRDLARAILAGKAPEGDTTLDRVRILDGS